MKRRVVFINLLILAGVLLFAARLRSSWESFEQEHDLEGIIESAQQEGGSASPSQVEPMGQSGPFSEFVIIAERTLFAEDRRPQVVEVEVEVETPAVVEEEPPKWEARPILHGVSEVGGKRQGVMTVFEGQRELRRVVVGDLVQGYWVDEIGETTMRLRWGSRNEIIDMADATPEAAGKPATGVTVIQVGSAPSAIQATTSSGAGQQQGSSIEVSVVAAPSNQGGAIQAEGGRQ